MLAALLCLSPVLSFAGSWSGSLVDSKCYDALERNVNPTDTLYNVDRDGYREIRYCSPTTKTKYFAVVPFDGPRPEVGSRRKYEGGRTGSANRQEIASHRRRNWRTD